MIVETDQTKPESSIDGILADDLTFDIEVSKNYFETMKLIDISRRKPRLPKARERAFCLGSTYLFLTGRAQPSKICEPKSIRPKILIVCSFQSIQSTLANLGKYKRNEYVA